MSGLAVLGLVIIVFAVFDLVAVRFGADSRVGFGADDRFGALR